MNSIVIHSKGNINFYSVAVIVTIAECVKNIKSFSFVFSFFSLLKLYVLNKNACVHRKACSRLLLPSSMKNENEKKKKNETHTERCEQMKFVFRWIFL